MKKSILICMATCAYFLTGCHKNDSGRSTSPIDTTHTQPIDTGKMLIDSVVKYAGNSSLKFDYDNGTTPPAQIYPDTFRITYRKDSILIESIVLSPPANIHYERLFKDFSSHWRKVNNTGFYISDPYLENYGSLYRLSGDSLYAGFQFDMNFEVSIDTFSGHRF